MWTFCGMGNRPFPSYLLPMCQNELQDYSYENVFHVYFHANKTRFHMKWFERGLVLKHRQDKEIQNWRPFRLRWTRSGPIRVSRGSNGWLMESLIGLCPNDLILVNTVLKCTEYLRLYTRCILNIKMSEAFGDRANGN